MNERITYFIDSLGISVSEFERVCNLSNGAVSKMGDNTRTSTLDKISNAYPALNVNWLRTGEGEMLKAGVYQYNQNGDNLNDQSVTIHKSDELLEILKTQSAQLAKSQEQIDRLLAIIERMQK